LIEVCEESVDNTEKAVTRLHTTLDYDPLIRQRDLPYSYPPPWSRAFLFVRGGENITFLLV